MIPFASAPMTYILIGITVLISYLAFSNRALLNKLRFYPYGIAKNAGEAYRFLTHGFIHGDTTHLLFNMFTFYFFGAFVEMHLRKHFGQSMGNLVYFGLYLSAIVVAALSGFFRHKSNSYYGALGASGAVSAVLFASILLDPLNGIHIIPFTLFFENGIPAYIFGPLYLIYTAYMDKRGRGKIAHDAHFMGAIYGMVAILLLLPDTFSNFIEKIISAF